MSTATCRSCGAEVLEEARFCEVCGAATASEASGASASAAPDRDGSPLDDAGSSARYAAPCAACGGSVAPDGYCGTCGARAVSERDHFEEQPAPWLAGTCDRGIRHERNEDAMALAVLPSPVAATDPTGGGPGEVGVIVVCDGVSSSTDPDVASLAAARAARAVLTGSRVQGPDTAAGHASAVAARIAAACEAADEAVVATTRDRLVASPASCTIVVAVLDGDLLALGWVGDSRAYWLPDQPAPARVLTIDDSVAAERMALGVPREQAENGPQAHAITRWLGVDSPAEPAHTVTSRLEPPGWLLVCSDGLWNYCSEPADLAALVATLASEHREPQGLSRALVDWAKERGGHDNITVGLARVSGGNPTELVGTMEGSTPDG